MSGTPVVDAHIHFWDPARLHYSWLPGELRRAFRPEDVDLGQVPVEGFVVVEADRLPTEALAEVDWFLSLSSPARPIPAVIAAAALGEPDGAAEIQALSRRPEVRGVRRLLQDERPGFSRDAGFVAAVRSLGERGLTFDLCVRHHQLAEAVELAAQCPQVTFVLDHLGKPRVRPHPERGWRSDIERLAALPNTHCKLSGLATEVLDPVATCARPAPYRPYLNHALQTFGPSRCLFGSDWPVSSTATTYEGWFDHVVDALAGYSSDDVAAVLGATARSVYRIGPAGGADAKVRTTADRRGGGELTWR